MKKISITIMLIAMVAMANTQSLKWVNNEDQVSSYPGIQSNNLDIDFNTSGDAYSICSRLVDLYQIGQTNIYVFDIVKIDANGDKVMSYTYDDDSAQSLTGSAFIKVDDAGNVYAVGNASGSAFLIKLDKDLNVIYKKHYAQLIPTNCGSQSNNFYICGNTNAGGLVVKYDKNNGK